MPLVKVAEPSWLERWPIVLGQGVFFNLCIFSASSRGARTAYRAVGHQQEEAVIGDARKRAD